MQRNNNARHIYLFNDQYFVYFFKQKNSVNYTVFLKSY